MTAAGNDQNNVINTCMERKYLKTGWLKKPGGLTNSKYTLTVTT